MKKTAGILIGIFLIAIIVFGVIKGKEYYNDRYVGKTYYTVVPEDYSMEIGMEKDDKGNDMTPAKEYNLIGYDKDGNTAELEFSVRTDDSNKLYQRGQYLEVERSKQMVLSEKEIGKTEVPENVLKLIEANK